MQSEEFVLAWRTRRRRQIVISGMAPLLILAVFVTLATADKAAPAAWWQKVVVLVGLVGIVTAAVASIFNARCPSCGALKGSGIFGDPGCSRCNMP